LDRAGPLEPLGAADLPRADADGAGRTGVPVRPAAEVRGGREEAGMRRLLHILLPMGEGGPAHRSAKRGGSGAGDEGRMFRGAGRPSPCARRSGLLRNPLRASLSQWERGLVVFAAVALMAFAEPAAAPDRPLPDPAQEARAQGLFRDIRCVV